MVVRSSFLVLVLLAGSPYARGQGAAGKPEPVLLVPEGLRPELDGALGAEEWRDAAEFEVGHAERVAGRLRIKRVGRDLYIAMTSEVLNPYAVNVRLAFLDPGAKTEVVANITPLKPPLPPLVLHRRRLHGGGEQRVPAGPSDVRFRFPQEGGFSFEAKLPLDELGFGRQASPYLFSAQVWELRLERCIAFYPSSANPAFLVPGYMTLKPGGNQGWGLNVALPTEVPVAQPALKLLEEIWREEEWRRVGRVGAAPPVPVIDPFVGSRDGRRRDAPLAKVEASLKEYWKQYPDYASFGPALLRVQVARNDFLGAKDTIEALAQRYPPLADTGFLLNARIRTLRDLGHYEAAARLLKQHWRTLADSVPGIADLRRQLEALSQDWVLEQQYRAQDAENDLPRVVLETTKGKILLELFEDDVANAVANFVSLVGRKFYDGTRFHEVAGGTLAAGGDPNSRDGNAANDGYGGPGYMIETEISRRLHMPYTISYLDRARRKHSEGSIFMLSLAPLPEFDGVQTVFGRVIEGHEVVRRLEYGDMLVAAKVVRKRNHPYKPVTRRR
ncbi:MAG: peptidylprolyl isomerase [Planctomycetota bacterium]|nr:peptidylprolyl isomerase [Planctomycetota bacterium]